MNCYLLQLAVNNVRTVSDTKREFYQHHARPINSIYRRVVDELLVEMHLLSVNEDFVYDPIYALGVVTTFDRFMQGYQPEGDQQSIFNALCRAVGSTPEQYRQDAEAARGMVTNLSLEEFKGQFQELDNASGQGGLRGILSSIAHRDRFKYNRPFGIGLYTLIETIDPEVLKDNDQRKELLQTLCQNLSISDEKIQKDLDLYRSNLEKFAQAQEVMKDMLEADRKKREQREKATQATSAEASQADAPSEPAGTGSESTDG